MSEAPYKKADQHMKRTALYCAGLILGMTGLAYASVPLYDLFCRVTGFGGTTQVASAAPKQALERRIKIRFDANVSPGLGWSLKPETNAVDIAVGETKTIYYQANNSGPTDSVGIASYNVSPPQAGAYFNKLQCFCFNDMVVKSGTNTEMPVVFFVDPAIDENPELKDMKEITLSYTMFPSKKSVSDVQKAGALSSAPQQTKSGG